MNAGYLKVSRSPMRKTAIILLLSFALVACGDSKQIRYEKGYRDGYAVGYNTACKIRSTDILGYWDDAEYSRGYAEGVTAGIIDCTNK